MQLSTDSHISLEDLKHFGAKPIIAFLDVARDALEEGDTERAELFICEAQERARDIAVAVDKLLAAAGETGQRLNLDNELQ